MPTTAVATYGAGRVDPLRYSEDTVLEVVNLKASTVFAAGSLIGEVTGTPGTYGLYASGNSDGTQNWTHILQYPCQTDASGNITLGTGTGGQEWAQTRKGAPAYTSGEFSSADIPNLDANALLDATSKQTRGRLLQGTVTSGRVLLYGA